MNVMPGMIKNNATVAGDFSSKRKEFEDSF
jgi:hypothetical protein